MENGDQFLKTGTSLHIMRTTQENRSNLYGILEKKQGKIAAGTISNVLGRLIAPGFWGLGAGYVGSQFISLPIDKDVIRGAGFVLGFVVILFAIVISFSFPLILEWLADRRESENERLQLENENLKLKLELQEKQSQPDNDE